MKYFRCFAPALVAASVFFTNGPLAFGQTTTSLPAPWASQDIGSPAVAGSAAHSSGTFTIQAAGTDIWGTSDQFHFVYQAMTGDGEVVARIAGVTAAHAWSKAGVMMRETLTKGSKHELAVVSAGKGVALQRRVSTGGRSYTTAGTMSAPPRWLRMVRTGKSFQAYESVDGQTWQSIGTSTNTMASTIYVGLAVTSHNSAKTTTATIGDVTVTPALVNQLPTVSLVAPANGATYTSPATIEISAAASDPDGTISTVDFYSGSALLGSGTAAPYSHSWSDVPAGTYTLTAVVTDNAGGRTTSAARTVTVSDPSSTVPGPWTAQDIGSPSVAGSASESAGTFAISGAGADIWGASDQFMFVHQQMTGDGEIVARVQSLTAVHAWSKAGVMMRESLSAGSRHATTLISGSNGAAFQRRTATNGSSLQTYGGAVIAPFWVRLVRTGDVFRAYESANGSSWTLIGSETMTMPPTVYAGLAVTSHDTTTATTAAFSNVSVGDVTPSNQPPTVALTAPANGVTLTAPATTTVIANATDSDGTVSKVDFFAGTSLIGTSFTAPYSVSWNDVPAGSYSLTAVATDDAGTTMTSPAISVTVRPVNQPPAVAITSPAPGASFTAPATLTMSANANDSDGSIARVDFYQGSTLIATDSTSPYAAAWSNVAAGSYTLTARATDDSGATVTSAPVAIIVTSNQPPTVTLTTPGNGLSFAAPAALGLAATASDIDGTIARVEFYVGTTLLGSDTTSPYAMQWNALSPGAYTVTAVAVDSAGARTTSAGVTVTARASLLVFNASADHAVLVTSYRLDVFPAGADPNVAMPVATRDLAKPAPVNGEISVDITSTLQPLAPGTYIATVSAIGVAGTSRSAAVTFTR